MKNLIISLLATKIIMGMGFWQFSDGWDAIIIAFTIAAVLFVSIEVIDEKVTDWKRRRELQRRRADRFKIEVIDLAERKSV